MTLATHAITGAALASMLPHQPILGFVLGFASHFPLDAIPHYDYPVYSDAIHPQKKAAAFTVDRAFLRDAFDFSLDAALGISISIAVFLPQAPLIAILAGAVGGILPDPLQFVAKKLPYAPLEALQRFHQWIHTPYRLRQTGQLALGIVSQIILICAIITAAWYIR